MTALAIERELASAERRSVQVCPGKFDSVEIDARKIRLVDRRPAGANAGASLDLREDRAGALQHVV